MKLNLQDLFGFHDNVIISCFEILLLYVLTALVLLITNNACGGGSRINAAARGVSAEPIGSSRCGFDDDQGTAKQHTCWHTNNSPDIAPTHQLITSG
jgi:hypothetical protein